MAGEEPSEDAEAGADATEGAGTESEGDAGGDSASDGPASGEAGPAADPGDDTPDSDDSGAEAADEADLDEPGRSMDDEAVADDDADEYETDDDQTDHDETDVDGAVEAEAEALVEEMEAAVAEAEPIAEDAGAEDLDEPDAEGGDEPVGGPPEDEPDDEIPPLAPDHEIDPDIDPPDPDVDLPDTPTAGGAGVEGPSEAEVEEPAVEEPPDHAGPVVDDEDAPEGVFGGGRSGPAEDREMPLADHIREMLQRLAVVIAVAGFVSLLVFPFAEDVINFLWYSILPGVESEIARPRLYGVLELVFTELKVASLAGLIVALPVMVYETYAFMRPGLYPHERRYYLAAIPTSLVLALVGVAFAYFVVLPAIFVYFLYYSQDVATIGFALGRTFDLILLMMGYLAVVFQIPLFLMLAMMMGLVTRRWLAERRLLFWMAFLGLSFFFGFDPTGMAPIIVAATMIALFEGTLLLTKWTGRE